MNDIQIFENSEFGKLEVLRDGDRFYFPATECATILHYVNPQKAIRDHCIEDGCTIRSIIDRLGRSQDKKYISEGNLYRLIVRSRLPKAQEFEEWVFDGILPTIRKYGIYATPETLEKFMRDPKSIGDVFYALAAEQEKNKKLKDENKKLAPKAKYYDIILQNPEAVPITLIAKDYGMSARAFNGLLNKHRIQYRVGGTWELYQNYAGNGYMHCNVFVTRSGENKALTCWTQKGRLFLYEFLKGFGYIPSIEQKKGELA